MKSIAELVSIALLSGLLASCASEQRTTVNSDRIVTNPIDLNYRFQPNEESRREAADPVLEYFKGYYYMFASKSGGYWRSEDLAKWGIYSLYNYSDYGGLCAYNSCLW